MTDEAMSPLRRRMIEDMTVRKLRREDAARTTSDTSRTSPPSSAARPTRRRAEDLRRYQLHLTNERRAAADHQQHGLGAAVLLHRHARPTRHHQAADVRRTSRASCPWCLSPEEVARFLEAAPGPKYKAALSAAYGAGLRVSEVVSLKVGGHRLQAHADPGRARQGAQGPPRDAVAATARAAARLVAASPDPGSGCFPDRTRSTPSPRASSTAPAMPPPIWPRSRSGCRRTRCATASPPICSSRTSTSA